MKFLVTFEEEGGEGWEGGLGLYIVNWENAISYVIQSLKISWEYSGILFSIFKMKTRYNPAKH